MGLTAVTSDSLAVLVDLLQRTSAPDSVAKLEILPGSGINLRTVQSVLDTLLPHGLTAIHLSGGGWVPSSMELRKEGMGMGVGGAGEWGIWRTDADTVKGVREIVDRALRNYAREL